MDRQRRLRLGLCLLLFSILACNFPQRFLFNFAGPQGGADLVGTLAAPSAPTASVGAPASADGQLDAASCDATAFVNVRVGERFVPEDSTSCYQDVVITNTHAIPARPRSGTPRRDPGRSWQWEIGVEPQAESRDQWSVVYYYGEPFTVDWYTPIFATPECIWLDGVRESGVEQLSSLGLTAVPFTVPSCIE
jgi:hypothetical protein